MIEKKCIYTHSLACTCWRGKKLDVCSVHAYVKSLRPCNCSKQNQLGVFFFVVFDFYVRACVFSSCTLLSPHECLHTVCAVQCEFLHILSTKNKCGETLIVFFLSNFVILKIQSTVFFCFFFLLTFQCSIILSAFWLTNTCIFHIVECFMSIICTIHAFKYYVFCTHITLLGYYS